jgi:hypothetical protein
MKTVVLSLFSAGFAGIAGCVAPGYALPACPPQELPIYQVSGPQRPGPYHPCGLYTELHERYHVTATANDVYVFDLQDKKTLVLRGNGKWEQLPGIPGMPGIP